MIWRRIYHYLPDILGFTHASNPVYHDGQVYFSSRDQKNRSHIFCAIFDPRTLKMGEPELVLSPGPVGSFDDSGCSVCQVTSQEIIYLGWNLSVTVPFRNSLCAADQETRFIIRQRDEKYLSISYGEEHDGKLWFGAITRWPMKCVIVGNPGLDYDDIVSKFSIVGEDMWFCHRSHDGQYAISHAMLSNGEWVVTGREKIRKNRFDSEAQCYPQVFDYENNRYMLYNGNNYGKTGFGLAILERT